MAAGLAVVAVIAVAVAVALIAGGGSGSATTTVAAGSSTTEGGTTSDAPTTSTTGVPSTDAPSTTSPATPTTQAAAACSAAGMAVPVLPADLPAAVADKVAAITTAAAACDFENLAALVYPGGFVFTIDPRVDAGDPAAFWSQREESGATPLGSLVEMLSCSYAVSAGPLGPVYVWPAVAAFDDWSGAPEAARQEIEHFYSADDIEAFELEGYLGTRIGITDSGQWVWFYDLAGGG